MVFIYLMSKWIIFFHFWTLWWKWRIEKKKENSSRVLFDYLLL